MHTRQHLIWVLVVALGAPACESPEDAVPTSYLAADWVTRTSDGTCLVHIDRITNGHGYFNDRNQQYDDGTVRTVFSYEGLFDGNSLSTVYDRESRDRISSKGWPLELQKNDRLLMQITPSLQPDDNTLDGILVGTVENGDFVAYAFIDEDWKRQFGSNVRILWGPRFDNSRPYAFDVAAKGCYADRISDSSGFLLRQVTVGGVTVGNVSPEDIEANRTDGLTAISLF